MILSVKNPINGEIGKIKDLTIEDFRSLSFILENGDDGDLENFLNDRLIGDINSLTKLLTLINARMQFVSEQITFNNGSTNVNIDIKFLLREILNNIKDIRTVIDMDDYQVHIDYPTKLVHKNKEDLLMDCIYCMVHKHKTLYFRELNDESKNDIISMFNAKAILKIQEVISDINSPITIFKARANLPDIKISLFDNSSFVFIRTLFSYYTYDEITELIFMISKRIPDLQYLNSRTPRDLELIIRLYSEEIEKSNTETKSTI
jgi:hypothetical protein